MTCTNSLALLACLGLAGCGWGGLPQPLFSVNGRVVDEANQPVAGAVVTDGQVSTLTDDTGRYVLGVFATTLSVMKPGRTVAHLEVAKDQNPTTHLVLGSQTIRVGLDSRFGGPGMSGLRAAIGAVATRLEDYPAVGTGALDALIIVTPGTLADAEINSLQRWVHAGGRLILCGAWGGYPQQDLSMLNALSQPAGITYTGAAVKSVGSIPGTDSWDNVSTISPPSLAKLAAGGRDNRIYLFSSTSLSLAAPARVVLAGDRNAYTVLGDSSNRVGASTLAAVGAAGLGKVFAFADSALWKDEDSGIAGIPNVQQGANSRLVGALLKW
jgi:hypothetical protein